MNAVATRADLPSVESSASDDKDRGGAIQQRLEALDISDREFERISKIGRTTLARAIANDSKVRDSTYDAIEFNLDKLEARASGQPVAIPVGDPADDLMEVSVEGNFGVRAVVKGPVRDRAAIQEFVANLIADMNSSQGGNKSGQSH